ncbi:helix-turn-helix domain-containing protein [Streptomyces sp. NPDC051286]|uniref:AraC-like ligand-binding domain-containing protein n=1 Tax=Streptomyces sp. NPDC051286 TaxID=3365647 RepID=UPI0037B5D3B5
MPFVLSTSSIPVPDRAEFWHEAVATTFVPLDVDLHEEKPSIATITSHQLGMLQVSQVTAGPQTVVRSRRMIARRDAEYLTLTMQHRGTARLEQDGRTVLVRPGEFSLRDSRSPYTKELTEEFGFTALQIPRAVLDVADNDLQTLTATVLSDGSPCAAVVATYLQSLARIAGDLTPGVGNRLAATTCDLLAVLIQERKERSAPEAPEAARAMLARIKDYLMKHLPDPDLSPEAIAAAHHISLRYLHKLFEHEETTVSRWIQRRRLDMCRRDLARTPSGPKVAAVAQRWGFVSPSHFSRVFRAAYGMSPREWQAAALPRA